MEGIVSLSTYQRKRVACRPAHFVPSEEPHGNQKYESACHCCSPDFWGAQCSNSVTSLPLWPTRSAEREPPNVAGHALRDEEVAAAAMLQVVT